MNNFNSWIGIDKTVGISSAYCLNQLKRIVQVKKIGHTGTLDPFASGVLCVAIGEATKTIQFINHDQFKEYEFVVKFGAETDTHDSEGKIIAETAVIPTQEDIYKVINNFIGKIIQIPPKYSALKVNGKRAYKLARLGQEFELKAREIEIASLELLELQGNQAKFKVSCSKGTYVRVLGADLAKSLGSLGHLIALRRTKDMIFNEKNIFSLEKLIELVHNRQLENYLHDFDAVLDDISVLQIDEEQRSAIRQGKQIRVTSEYSKDFLRVKCGGKLVAICRQVNNLLMPVRVFNI
jgi:tRNA pseudouridine55 synthase